ncbi:MAG: glycosyltransferase family 4 protein [Phycisphaerales bacterium JB039]
MTEPPPSSATAAHAPGPLRIILQQPALPKYRIPVFRELAARPGLEVTVLYSGGSDIPAAAADGFEATRVQERILLRRPRQLRWEPAQIASASRRRCDVLVLEWNAGVASLVPALLLARLRGVGTVLWGHGYSKREQPGARAVRNAVGRLADCLLLYNHMAADALVAYGFRPDRIFVALNALDQTPIARARDTWRASPGRMQEFRESRDVAGRRIVLFVSRLEADNGIDLLIRAAASLKDSRPELTVAIIGHGPAQPDLERLAAELGVADRVRFLGAIYEEDELAPWFLAADVFCYPRNIGLSLLHAFGYGLPVITDDNLRAQNPEIEALRDGKNGLLYKAGDTGALAAAIDRLLTDEPLRQRLSAEAERTVAEQFTLANMVDGMEAAIRAAAKRG